MTVNALAANQLDFLNAVGFFRQAFVIVFALALTEALKQFVNDKQSDDTKPNKHIQWDRLPALLSFLFLIVPFFQGTVRYFYSVYESQKPFANYAEYLAFDGIMFLIEAALFFAMSRAITPAKWHDLYKSIIGLLVVDTVWSAIALTRGNPTLIWIYLNAGLAVFLFFMLIFTSREKPNFYAALACTIAVVIRTVLDYYFDWSTYFPQA
jgi:hypothetical protein